MTTAAFTKQGSYKGIVRLLTPGPVFEIHSQQSYERRRVEEYIADKFFTAYGAHISEFMPDILTMRCANRLSGAVGIRLAGSEKLFLERYLNATIETSVEQQTGKATNRSAIIEIGNLVATHRGSSQLLFILLTAILHKLDCEWCVFTATPIVERLLGKLGLKLYTLGHASANALDNDDAKGNWGTYYDSQPKVFSVSPKTALKNLQSRKTLASILALYQSRTTMLASVLGGRQTGDQCYELTA